MNDIKAIETRYAGCHFRSRLEARWAVFFDTLGVEWEYEPQGFELPWRLHCADVSEGAIQYLPDFHLPAINTWVEVKGAWTADELDRFMNAAAGLMGHCGGANFVVLPSVKMPWFGGLKTPSPTWRPYALHFHKGDVMAGPWNPRLRECGGYMHDGWSAIARDVGGDGVYSDCGWSAAGLRHTLLDGVHHRGSQERASDDAFCAALTAARSARFEHGQSGAA